MFRLTPVLAAACLFLVAAAPPPPLSAPDAALAERARLYLQDLGTTHSSFTQIDGRGGQSQGEIWLQRPGRARLDYAPPSGLIISSDGHSVTVRDRRLKSLQSYPLGLTPMSLFLGRRIRLDHGVIITQVNHQPDGFSIVARDARKRNPGQIELLFRAAPLTLTGWIITDPRGTQVRVRLGDLEPAAAHDLAFFEIWRVGG